MALLTGQVKKLLTLGGVKSFARCLLDSGQRFIEDSMRNLTAKITVKVSNQYAYYFGFIEVFFLDLGDLLGILGETDIVVKVKQDKNFIKKLSTSVKLTYR